jgi:hypothetical protein
VDFLIGSFSTLVITLCIFKYISYLYNLTKEKRVYRFSQSSMHEMVKHLLPDDLFKPKPKKTQSMVHEEKINIRVVILDGLAYWIKDNKIYEADLDSNGIDKNSTRIVDTMSMSKVQLDKIVFIVDKLREGLDDDSGSTGDW